MKLTFVAPRFGKDIVGGAEYAIGQLAKNCIEYGNVDAEILTTTAGDERTWSKKYLEGTEFIDDICVKRFANEPIVRSEFDNWSSPFLEIVDQMSSDDFEQWLVRQGPYSPDLLDAIEECDSDAIIFHPMLSSPTSHGIFRAKVPTVLHPALHDEPLAYMSGYTKVINRASLLSFSTIFEQDLSSTIHNSYLQKQSVLGFGIDDPILAGKNEEQTILNKYDVNKDEYFIVLGRVDVGKGSDVVTKFFQEYVKTNNNKKLMFVGPVSQNSILSDKEFLEENSEHIITTGIVDDVEKNTLVANASALINPSVTESFSLVMLEAMKLKVPVIINMACGPTYEHINRSNSGYFFEDYSSFNACLQLVSEDSSEKDNRIKNGFLYVEENYSWEKIISKYMKLLNNL